MGRTVSIDKEIPHEVHVERTFNLIRQVDYLNAQERATLQRVVLEVLKFSLDYERRLDKNAREAMRYMATMEKDRDTKKTKKGSKK